jgi:hypothetical protein
MRGRDQTVLFQVAVSFPYTYPQESIRRSKHSESLKSRTILNIYDSIVDLSDIFI